MHDFRYKNNRLYCEDVLVEDIAREIGTPFYLYSSKTITDHTSKLEKAFADIDFLLCYSLKANANLAICRLLARMDCGADIVSGGELFKALKAGFPPKKIVYAGVGKTKAEIKFALDGGILLFNVESLAEAKMIAAVAKQSEQRAKIAVRVNPDVDPHTHNHITTGKKENKFGIALDSVLEMFTELKGYENLSICGIHIHIGSQITDTGPYVKVLKKVTPLINKLRKRGFEISIMNIGGGLGIVYKAEKTSTAAEFSQAVLPLVKESGCRLVLEPGRFIVGNAGILVTSILYRKRTVTKDFVIVDAGMNDLLRPALYEAYHEIRPTTLREGEETCVDIVGPVCETADCFASERSLPHIEEGDLLAIFGAGAYAYVMASNYNARLRPPEVLVEGSQFRIVRQRESYEDLIRGEFCE